MDGHARAFARGVEARHRGLVGSGHDPRVDVRRDAPHRVVRRGLDRDRLLRGLHLEVDARELGDVRELLLEDPRVQMREVQEDVIASRSEAASLLDLLIDRAGDHVTGREVLDRGGVSLHEPFPVAVADHRALAAGAFGQEHAEPVQAGRVELEELHVLEWDAAPERHREAVTREGVGVRGDPEHPAVAAGREQDRLRAEHVELTRRELVRHHPRGAAVVREQEVEAVELVEEANVPLHALLVQGLQDHVTRTVRGVAGAFHRPLAVVRRVAAEAPLVDAALGRPVERQSPALELVDRVDRLVREDLRRRLVHEVVAALDRVEGVPLRVVLLDVAECGTDARPAPHRCATGWGRASRSRRS